MRDVEQRCLAGDRHRFLYRRGRQLQVRDRLLSDNEFQPPCQGGEPRELRRDVVEPGPQRQAVIAVLVGYRNEGIARCLVDRGHGDSWQHGVRGVGHHTAEAGFLCVADDRDTQAEEDRAESVAKDGRSHVAS